MGWGWGGVVLCVCGRDGAAYCFARVSVSPSAFFCRKVDDGSFRPRPRPHHRLPCLPTHPHSPHNLHTSPNSSPGCRHHPARRLRPRRASKCRAGCMHARWRDARRRRALTACLHDAGQASWCWPAGGCQHRFVWGEGTGRAWFFVLSRPRCVFFLLAPQSSACCRVKAVCKSSIYQF